MPGKSVKNAYLAGLIDGEGSLYLKLDDGNGVMAQLTIAMCSEETIGWIAENFGGRVERVNRVRKENHSQLWRWRVHGAMAAVILKDTIPYMVTKRRLAELFVEFVGESYRGWYVPDDFRLVRQEIYEEYLDAR